MTFNNTTILITGATGFLGGALAMRLAAEGARVKALARNPQKGDFLRQYANIEIVSGDIGDGGRMRAVAQGCDYVFHVAAVLGGSLDHQRRGNVEGTRHITQAAGEAGVKRLVHVSTISVYGYHQRGEVREDTPPLLGNDPYGITKAEAEKVLRAEAAKFNLAYSIIRPGMIYGPRSGMWTGNMFRVARRKPTIFLGDGSGSAFPIYVDDVVDLTTLLATHPAAIGEAFNCAPDPSPTWRAFLGGYAALAGHQGWFGIPAALVYPLVGLVAAFARPQTQMKDLPAMLRFGTGRITFKMTKARDKLGWAPKVDLATGIQRCAPWLREQGLLA